MIVWSVVVALAGPYEAHLLYPCASGMHECDAVGCEHVAAMDGGPRVLPTAELSVLHDRFPEARRDLELVPPESPDAQCREAFARLHALGRRRHAASAVQLYEQSCFEGDHIGSCHALRDLLSGQESMQSYASHTAKEAEMWRDVLLATARAHQAGREVRFESAPERQAPVDAEIHGMTDVPSSSLVDWTTWR